MSGQRIKLGVHEAEEEFLKDIAGEQVELYGNDDVKLYVMCATDNSTNHDPLYGEPVEYTYKFNEYSIRGSYHDFSTTVSVEEGGEYIEWTQTLDIAVKHLEEEGVPPLRPRSGDACAILIKGVWEYFDIIQHENDGVMSQRGFHTSLILDLKKNTKFDPVRMVKDNE